MIIPVTLKFLTANWDALIPFLLVSFFCLKPPVTPTVELFVKDLPSTTPVLVYEAGISLWGKRASMLTDLKVWSLAFEFVFYRPKHTAKRDPEEWNREGLEMQQLNIPTEKAERVDKKNGVICLFIMFTSTVMVIKMPKMYFLLMTAKNQLQFEQNI